MHHMHSSSFKQSTGSYQHYSIEPLHVEPRSKLICRLELFTLSVLPILPRSLEIVNSQDSADEAKSSLLSIQLEIAKVEKALIEPLLRLERSVSIFQLRR